MSKVLGFAAVAEAATGLALLVVPSLVGQLLLGQQLAGVAIPVARVTGIALIALGIGCGPATPLVGMFVYSAVVTLYLAYLGFAGEFFRGAAVARGRSSRPPVNPSRAGSISRCGSYRVVSAGPQPNSALSAALSALGADADLRQHSFENLRACRENGPTLRAISFAFMHVR